MSLTKKDIVNLIAERNNIYKAQAEEILSTIGDIVHDVLAKGEEVALPGIGRFAVKERAARTGRNPQTGESLDIPAKKHVKFTVAKSLRDAAEMAK